MSKRGEKGGKRGGGKKKEGWKGAGKEEEEGWKEGQQETHHLNNKWKDQITVWDEK